MRWNSNGTISYNPAERRSIREAKRIAWRVIIEYLNELCSEETLNAIDRGELGIYPIFAVT